MSAEFFDSNVFVYLFDETNEKKRKRAEGLVESALQSQAACISFQVVQETLNVLTRKLPAPMGPGEAGVFLEAVLAPLWRVMPSERLYEAALRIQGRYRYGFYDALIVAAALEAGCKTLYSEDMHDGHELEGLSIENPFRAAA